MIRLVNPSTIDFKYDILLPCFITCIVDTFVIRRLSSAYSKHGGQGGNGSLKIIFTLLHRHLFLFSNKLVCGEVNSQHLKIVKRIMMPSLKSQNVGPRFT